MEKVGENSDAVKTSTHPKAALILHDFVPFLLNEAAETVAKRFSSFYVDRYSMTRSQWRVMANLGRFGKLTATEISHHGHLEKSVVSRAVFAMEKRGWLTRHAKAGDRRVELLSLTGDGQETYMVLAHEAKAFDDELRSFIETAQVEGFVAVLRRLNDEAELPAPPGTETGNS